MEVEPSRLVLSLGFSHKVYMDIPKTLKLNIDEKYKNILHIAGFDKQLV
jgi:large subunit ribosomal protein L6